MTLSLPNKRQQFRQTLHLERISIWGAIAGTGLAVMSQQILYACVPLFFYVALLNRDRVTVFVDAANLYQIASKDLVKRRDGSVKADLDLELDMRDLADTEVLVTEFFFSFSK